MKIRRKRDAIEERLNSKELESALAGCLDVAIAKGWKVARTIHSTTVKRANESCCCVIGSLEVVVGVSHDDVWKEVVRITNLSGFTISDGFEGYGLAWKENRSVHTIGRNLAAIFVDKRF